MLDIRSKEEAEGDRRIIGSERLEETAEDNGLEGAGIGREASCCVAEGLEDCAFCGRRPRKSSTCLRT